MLHYYFDYLLVFSEHKGLSRQINYITEAAEPTLISNLACTTPYSILLFKLSVEYIIYSVVVARNLA